MCSSNKSETSPNWNWNKKWRTNCASTLFFNKKYESFSGAQNLYNILLRMSSTFSSLASPEPFLITLTLTNMYDSVTSYSPLLRNKAKGQSLESRLYQSAFYLAFFLAWGWNFLDPFYSLFSTKTILLSQNHWPPPLDVIYVRLFWCLVWHQKSLK